MYKESTLTIWRKGMHINTKVNLLKSRKLKKYSKKNLNFSFSDAKNFLLKMHILMECTLKTFFIMLKTPKKNSVIILAGVTDIIQYLNPHGKDERS